MGEAQTMRVLVPERVVTTEVEEDAVLLNLESGQYYRLDEVGTRMWVLLGQHACVELAVASMLAEYDVSEADLRRDIIRLVGELSRHGLLEVVGD